MTVQDLYVVLSSLPKELHNVAVWIQNGDVFTPIRALVITPVDDLDAPEGRVSLVTGWIVTPKRVGSASNSETAPHVRPEAGGEGGGL